MKIIFVHFAQKPNNVFVQYAENYFCIKWRILGFKWDNVCAIFPVDKLLRMCYYWNSGLTSRRRPEVLWIASLHFMYFSQIKPKERMKTFDGGGVFQEKFYLILIKWFALRKTLTKSFLNSSLRFMKSFQISNLRYKLFKGFHEVIFKFNLYKNINHNHNHRYLEI